MTSMVLRCGIMCNSTVFKAWQVKAIDELLASGVAEISLLIIDGRKSENNKQTLFQKIFSKTGIYKFYYNRFVKSEALREIDLSEKLKDVSKLYCEPDILYKCEIFSDKDVEIIKTNNLDFIIRFGFNIVKGEILDSAKHGIWSYHHGDEMKYRGGPPAFWEIFNNDNVTGTVLQKLTDKLDAGIILKKGYYKTIDHSYKETLNTILLESSYWITQVCREIKISDKENPEWKKSSTKAKVYTFPDLGTTLLFLVKLCYYKLKFHLKDLLLVEQWNIGIVKQSAVDFLENGINREITFFPLHSKKYFAADAFGFKQNDGKIGVCFENYNYKDAQAEIYLTNFDLNTRVFSKPVPIISSERHLAYPYILNTEEAIYCLPEQNEKEQFIYKLNKHNNWEKEQIDLPESDLIDCTIFKHFNYYWLFSTRRFEGSNLKLFVYYSENLKGSYLPHALNPVKTDISSARPAGTPFVIDGILYRPSQDSSETYGGRIRINKITSLSPTSFSEETIKIIKPFHPSFNKGIHTFAVVNDFIIIDSKRFIFSYNHFVNKLKSKLGIN